MNLIARVLAAIWCVRVYTGDLVEMDGFGFGFVGNITGDCVRVDFDTYSVYYSQRTFSASCLDSVRVFV